MNVFFFFVFFTFVPLRTLYTLPVCFHLGVFCFLPFQVTLPNDVMLEEDTTLATLAPIIKSGGVVPDRLVCAAIFVVLSIKLTGLL